jgi:hypothetical protein
MYLPLAYRPKRQVSRLYEAVLKMFVKKAPAFQKLFVNPSPAVRFEGVRAGKIPNKKGDQSFL